MNQLKKNKNLSTFLNEIKLNSSIDSSFNYKGYRVQIEKDFSVRIDNEQLDESFSSSEEAISYTHSYIDNIENIANTRNSIPDEKLITIIQKHHNIQKITDTLLENYKQLASSEKYTIDSVITELKQKENSTLYNKLEYVLEDNTRIALTAETQELISEQLKNKQDICNFMVRNKTNFMNIVRGII